MPTFVRTETCDGCEGRERIACVSICPHDLMALDQDGSDTGWAKKAWNQEPSQCWACYACVKACPQQAIEFRAAADAVPMGARVQPQPDGEAIAWTIEFRNGDQNRFEYPVRTRPADSVEPYAGKPAADLKRIAELGFFDQDGPTNPGDPAELIHT
jgi:adenylylsulfate reductase subunit B